MCFPCWRFRRLPTLLSGGQACLWACCNAIYWWWRGHLGHNFATGCLGVEKSDWWYRSYNENIFALRKCSNHWSFDHRFVLNGNCRFGRLGKSCFLGSMRHMIEIEKNLWTQLIWRTLPWTLAGLNTGWCVWNHSWDGLISLDFCFFVSNDYLLTGWTCPILLQTSSNQSFAHTGRKAKTLLRVLLNDMDIYCRQNVFVFVIFCFL